MKKIGFVTGNQLSISKLSVMKEIFYLSFDKSKLFNDLMSFRRLKFFLNKDFKPSSGAIALALFSNIPALHEIILSGFSFRKSGHFYDKNQIYPAKHIASDRLLLKMSQRVKSVTFNRAI